MDESAFSRKNKSFMISFRQGCKFMGEGYPWIATSNSSDSTVSLIIMFVSNDRGSYRQWILFALP